MKNINTIETRAINGGRTYHCIDCSYKSSSFWSVYWHVLSRLHFRSNKYLNALWKAGKGCITSGLRMAIMGGI